MLKKTALITYGLIGKTLSHSFSAKYFAEKFKKEGITDSEYKNFPLENISKVKDLLTENPNLRGFNVTIPYKKQIIHYLHELSPEAEKIGAVNTVKVIRNKNEFFLKGFNTDVYGFEKSIQPLLESHHKKALILGTGGASDAVKFVFEKLKIEYLFVSRQKSENAITYVDLDKNLISDYKIIVNCTPLGTFPDVENCPAIPYEHISGSHLLYDLVYNPAETKFLNLGKQKNAKTINGLQMLHLQAEKAWEIFV